MEFEELRIERETLNNAVLRHSASIAAFRARDWAWFKLEVDERLRKFDAKGVRHLSTSASCIESLSDIPASQAGYGDAREMLDATRNAFATRALEREKWESDRAAEVYCRVRTLPIVLDHADGDTLKPFADAIRTHVQIVWNQLDPKSPETQGIAEKPMRKADDEEPDGKRPQLYPPNAFHTYWALRLLSAYRRHAPEFGGATLTGTINVKRAVALLWCNRTLAAQTSLIRGKAQRFDAQQLAWALLADYEGGMEDDAKAAQQPATTANARSDLYASALEAFFSQQDESGGWPLYDPLFHYPNAGNAYCYTFETLAQLLRPALLRREGRLLRDLLRPHLPRLIKARQLADRTAIELGEGGLGWSSGHHPHRQHAEAWATASVFSYLQALRRLVGHWTADAAERRLGVRKPKYVDRDTATAMLVDRGATWTSDAHPLNVGRELAGLFAHPRLARHDDRTRIDPDAPLIHKKDARSAILFGPPGTGKTTLVEALAGMIGWDFLEIPASAFLSEGMDQVPARADAIFTELMELDRVVVLFDEVDELIRFRESERSDPFGRFLTTSMLPKLAKLWEQRRVLFFVATNSIANADPAIRRSQRFDGAIFTAPPSFRKKQVELAKLLKQPPPAELTKASIEQALAGDTAKGPEGAYALLRWDQLGELARLTLDAAPDGNPSITEVKSVLGEMGQRLADLEYRIENGNGSNNSPKDIFGLWRTYWTSSRRDFGRRLVVRIDKRPGVLPERSEVIGECEKTGVVYVDLSLALDQLVFDAESDTCTLLAGDQQLKDVGVLEFEGA